MGGVGTDASSLYPPTSPLIGGGNTAIAYVAEEAGWYYRRRSPAAAAPTTSRSRATDRAPQGDRGRRRPCCSTSTPAGSTPAPGAVPASATSRRSPSFVPQWGIARTEARRMRTASSTRCGVNLADRDRSGTQPGGHSSHRERDLLGLRGALTRTRPTRDAVVPPGAAASYVDGEAVRAGSRVARDGGPRPAPQPVGRAGASRCARRRARTAAGHQPGGAGEVATRSDASGRPPGHGAGDDDGAGAVGGGHVQAAGDLPDSG